MTDHNMLLHSHKPSDIIDISRLEKETQNLLFIGLIFAFFIHSVIGSYFMFKKTDVLVTHGYPIKFVIHTARITKPYELKSPPASTWILQKHNLSIKPPVARVEAKTTTKLDLHDIIQELKLEEIITGHQEYDRTGFQNTEADKPVSVKSSERISMKKEMISVEDFDTGRYKAMVVQKASNLDIKGFVYIAATWGAQLKVPDHLKGAIINLAEAVTRYTSIQAKVDSHLLLDSRDIFNIPFIYITTDKAFQLTPTERENFGKYLRSGGFAVLDNGEPNMDYSQAESSLRQMIRDTLGSGTKFTPIPREHPLYHCYFKFDDGPPQGSEIQMVVTSTSNTLGHSARNSSLAKTVYFLEGIWLDGRLVAVYSNKGYGAKWKEFENNEPQLKMGVNMVVYALTQEGGISQKIMRHYSTVQ